MIQGSIRISVIITVGPGLGSYLRECLGSVAAQGLGALEVLIVFDGEPTLQGLPSWCRTVEVVSGNVQHARRAGLDRATGAAVFFLDVDNQLGHHALDRLRKQLEHVTQDDPRIAGVYPTLSYWDARMDFQKASPGGTGQNSLVATEFSRSRFDREPFLDAGCLVWREALFTSWQRITTHERLEDRQMWSQLIDDGWRFAPCPQAELRYRVRSDSMSRTELARDYYTQFCLDQTPVTVFVPLAGYARRSSMERLSRWLNTVPDHCPIVLCDGSGSPAWFDASTSLASPQQLLAIRGGRDVRYIRVDGIRGDLADAPRQSHEQAVNVTVARIYNRLARELTTPLALVLEDDVFPRDPAPVVLRRLLQGLDRDVFAVSGLYLSRREGHYTAWLPSADRRACRFLTPHDLSRFKGRYLDIEGSGFGCLLIRREELRRIPQAVGLSVDAERAVERWYDIRFFRRAQQAGFGRVRLARDVVCDHGTVASVDAASPRRIEAG